MDLVLSEYSAETLKWYKNVEGGGDTWLPQTITTGIKGITRHATIDANNDGMIDLVSLANLDGQVRLHRNIYGSGTLWETSVVYNGVAYHELGYGLAVGDMNGDGWDDVISTTSETNQVFLHLNNKDVSCFSTLNNIGI